MVLRWIGYTAVGVAIAAAVILGVAAFTSQGQPAPPTATLSVATLTPSTAQVTTITFQAQVWSQQPPNGIDLIPPKVTYNVWQAGLAGAATRIADNQSTALAVVSSTGGFGGTIYTLVGSATLALPAICQTIGCVGFGENLTVNAVAQVPLYYALLSSPQAHIVFSTNPVYDTHAKAAPTPDSSLWYWGFYGALTGAFAIVATAIAIIVRHVGTSLAAAFLVILVLVEYAVWVIW